MEKTLMSRRFSTPVLGAVLLCAAPVIGQAQGVVYRVPVTGVVELGMAPFIERSIEEAA